MRSLSYGKSWDGQMTVKSLGNSEGVEDKHHMHVVLYHWRGLSELLGGVGAPSESENIKSYLHIQTPGQCFQSCLRIRLVCGHSTTLALVFILVNCVHDCPGMYAG